MFPLENMVYANQQLYYEAIESSTQQADCGPFIDFMLNEILNALKKYQGEPLMWKTHRLLPLESETRWKFQTEWSENTLLCCGKPILSVGMEATRAVIGNCL